jgi:hypothetical protein
VTTYAQVRDVLRLLWLQKRDHIAAYRAEAEKGAKADRVALSHMAMDVIHVQQLEALAFAGRLAAAVIEAHERDPDALAAVIGRPLEASSSPEPPSAAPIPPIAEQRSA